MKNTDKETKIGGQLAITYEMLNSLLYIPEGCKIVGAQDDTMKDIVRFKIHGTEVKGGTAYKIPEGGEYPAIRIDTETYAVKLLEKAKEIELLAQRPGDDYQWARNAVTQVELGLNFDEEE